MHSFIVSQCKLCFSIHAWLVMFILFRDLQILIINQWTIQFALLEWFDIFVRTSILNRRQRTSFLATCKKKKKRKTNSEFEYLVLTLFDGSLFQGGFFQHGKTLNQKMNQQQQWTTWIPFKEKPNHVAIAMLLLTWPCERYTHNTSRPYSSLTWLLLILFTDRFVFLLKSAKLYLKSQIQ